MESLSQQEGKKKFQDLLVDERFSSPKGVFKRDESIFQRKVASLFAALLSAGLVSQDVGGGELQEPSEVEKWETKIAEIERTLPIRFSELKDLCRTELLLDVGAEGKYVLHLGPLHARESTAWLDLNDERRRSVVESQKKLYSILRYLADKEVRDFFFEGVSKIDSFLDLEKDREKFKEIQHRVLSARNTDFLKFTKEFVRKYFSESQNHPSAPSKQNQYLSYWTRYRLRSMVDSSNDEIEASIKKEAGALDKALDKMHLGQPDTLWHIGASVTLFLEGRINILPTEDPKEFAEAKVVLDEFEKKYKPGDKFASVEEARRYKKEIFDDREAQVVKTVQEYAEKYPDRRLFPVIFGSSHDFTEQVMDFNINNKKDGKAVPPLGLIRCITTEP